MNTKAHLRDAVEGTVAAMYDESVAVTVESPVQTTHGDYSTNIAMILGKKLGRNPMEIAAAICEELRAKSLEQIEKIEVVKPGFINFWLTNDVLLETLQPVSDTPRNAETLPLKGKRIMVEYAHPNTHKEMHIGHMRTLITGEAISRLLEDSGATVFRANYQGDIGPHVAKALYGIKALMKERDLNLDEVTKWSNSDKAHFLGEGYVRGSKDYEAVKEEIDAINTVLYKSIGEEGDQDKDSVSADLKEILSLYTITRQWSLDYYEEFYSRFATKFDQLFFESQVAVAGKKIVEKNIGAVFVKENGAIIFPGEKYGLHTRVFITQAGNPTYEGKEMGNAYAEYDAFSFDLKMHIVASEQAGYFQVVFKALDLIDPEKFEGKQHHLSMGMVTLTDPSAGSGQARKMSSRTGDILTVDWLIDQVRARVQELAREGKVRAEKLDETIEMITIGAIKYSVLKGGTGSNAAFDIEKSVSLDGNSGPYLQYTYARTRSILGKSSTFAKASADKQIANRKSKDNDKQLAISDKLEAEESQLLRRLYQFTEVTREAAQKYAPNVLCTYLYELAAEFNLFYQRHKVVGSEQEAFRLALTASVGKTLKNGLHLLGIDAPEKM